MIQIPFIAAAKWVGGNWKGLAVVGIAAAVMFFIWSWDARGNKIDELENQVKGYRDVVAAQLAWHDETVSALERKAQSDDERSNFEAESARRNQADREAGDGPLAPVLRNGIGSLSRRQAERNKRNPG